MVHENGKYRNSLYSLISLEDFKALLGIIVIKTQYQAGTQPTQRSEKTISGGS
jgi:hypothetical protein